MTIRPSAAAVMLALALAGCASDDYGDMRRSRFDHPYRGGAATASTSVSVSDSRSLKPVETLGALVFVSVFVLACNGQVDWPLTWEPPPPSPYGY